MPKGDFNKVARLLLQLSSLITSSALISDTLSTRRQTITLLSYSFPVVSKA